MKQIFFKDLLNIVVESKKELDTINKYLGTDFDTFPILINYNKNTFIATKLSKCSPTRTVVSVQDYIL